MKIKQEKDLSKTPDSKLKITILDELSLDSEFQLENLLLLKLKLEFSEFSSGLLHPKPEHHLTPKQLHRLLINLIENSHTPQLLRNLNFIFTKHYLGKLI